MIPSIQTFGRLTIVSESERTRSSRQYLCRCSCGKEKVIAWQSLKAGLSRSCGCVIIENLIAGNKRRATHKGTKTPTWNSWRAMRRRCNNSKCPQFADYGGRGIRVCERWNNSYMLFLEDMGERPKGTTLDRIDNNGNYEPGNCRWSTWAVQASNRRAPRRRKHGGGDE